jgi:hypothetical protein
VGPRAKSDGKSDASCLHLERHEFEDCDLRGGAGTDTEGNGKHHDTANPAMRSTSGFGAASVHGFMAAGIRS